MKITRLFGVALLALAAGCIVKVSNSTSSSPDRWNIHTNAVFSGSLAADVPVLNVENHFGSVRIVGTDSEEGRWTQTLAVRAGNAEDARELVTLATCVTRTNNGGVWLSVSADRNGSSGSYGSDLEISVPKHTLVRVQNEYGPIMVSGLNTNLEVTGQSGTIEIRDVTGEVEARNRYGNLDVRNVGKCVLRNQSGSTDVSDVHGRLDVENAYATVTVRNVAEGVRIRNQGGRIEVESVGDVDIHNAYAVITVRKVAGNAVLHNTSGKIEIEEVSGDVNARTAYASMEITGSSRNIDCENVSGSIRIRARSKELESLRARTAYAQLEVELSSELKPMIEAETSYGKVQSDFPLVTSFDPATGIQGNPARIRLNNQSANIRVLRR